MTQHVHTPAWRSQGWSASGAYYQGCECGAIRWASWQGKTEDWHVCELCTRADVLAEARDIALAHAKDCGCGTEIADEIGALK